MQRSVTVMAVIFLALIPVLYGVAWVTPGFTLTVFSSILTSLILTPALYFAAKQIKERRKKKRRW